MSVPLSPFLRKVRLEEKGENVTGRGRCGGINPWNMRIKAAREVHTGSNIRNGCERYEVAGMTYSVGH
jgi:hypothetical protein